MKRLAVSVLITLMLVGCTSTRIATNIGARVGDSFRGSSARGLESASEIKSCWPYVSGLIRGLYADNYDIEVPVVAKNIITQLDALAAKEKLTDDEKGKIIGYYVRLEALALELGWSKYGVNIYQMIVKVIG